MLHGTLAPATGHLLAFQDGGPAQVGFAIGYVYLDLNYHFGFRFTHPQNRSNMEWIKRLIKEYREVKVKNLKRLLLDHEYYARRLRDYAGVSFTTTGVFGERSMHWDEREERANEIDKEIERIKKRIAHLTTNKK